MKWVRDLTGRFPERPHYEDDELDYQCETLVSSFLRSLHGEARYPISTDDLTKLVERHASDLDLGADLSEEGQDVEGLTWFVPDQKPVVRIDVRLVEQEWRENRLRTTLTHELGHVKFHAFLWAGKAKQPPLFGPDHLEPARCVRSNIVNAKQIDWMEWQAGYASGAILMPISVLRKIVSVAHSRASRPIGVGTAEGEQLLAAIQKAFRVSRDAARVRLMQKGMLLEAQESTQF